MKTLFDTEQAASILQRLQTLQHDSAPQWGSMQVAQTLAHCTAGIEMARGTLPVKRASFPLNSLGVLIKPLFFRDDASMRRNSPSAPELFPVAGADCHFERERARLIAAMKDFVRVGPGGCTVSPHPFFGSLEPRQWGILMYKHLDHHLRQFGA